MPLSTCHLLGDEAAHHERQQMAWMVRSVNFGMATDQKKVGELLKRLEE